MKTNYKKYISKIHKEDRQDYTRYKQKEKLNLILKYIMKISCVRGHQEQKKVFILVTLNKKIEIRLKL